MEIPNEELLYRFASPSAFPKDQVEIPVSVFHDPELSCDWRRYRLDPRTSPHIAQGRSTIVVIKVCNEVKFPHNERGVPIPSCFQQIIHDPLDDTQEFGPNAAHSLVRGRKKLPVITALRNNSYWGTA
jgi:hypothetical protein